MAGCVGLVAPLAWGDSPLLSQARWAEPAYGLSLQVPRDAQSVEATSDGARVKFVTEPGTTYSIYIRQSNTAVSLASLSELAIQQFTFSHSDAVVIKQADARPLHPADRASVRVLFAVPQEGSDGWLAQQVFMLIDPLTVAMFQLDVDAEDMAQAMPTFEAMVNSAVLIPVETLEQDRTALVEAGDVWRTHLPRDLMKRGLVEEQWFRIVRDNRDVGYRRERQTAQTQAMGQVGLGVEIKSHLEKDGQAFDTISEFFESDDQQTEIWSIKTTRRKLKPSSAVSGGAMNLPQVETLSETGVRSGATLTVDCTLPSGGGRKSWQLPPKGYLSQVQMQLLPSLVVGRDRPKLMLMYAYNSNTGTLALRREQVEPLLNGAYLLRVRPAPQAGEQVSTYDRHGRLIRRQMADGTVLLPTSIEQIKAIHRIP